MRLLPSLLPLRVACIATAILFSVFSTVTAGTYLTPHSGVCHAGDARTDCDQAILHFGLEVFFVQAATSEQTYAFNNPDTDSVLYEYVSPDVNAGLEASAAFHFGFADDISLHYLHLDGASRAGVGEDAHFPFGTFTQGTPTSVAADFSYGLDALFLELGQAMSFSTDVTLRPHIAIGLARIDSLKRFDQTTVGTVGTARADYDSQFEGVGMQAGVDVLYQYHRSIAMQMRMAAGLLVGTQDLQVTFTPVVGEASGARISAPDHLVPFLQFKPSFAREFDYYGLRVVMNIGWHVQAYFNAVRSYQSQTPVLTAIASSPRGSNPLTHSAFEHFTIHGPFLSLRAIA